MKLVKEGTESLLARQPFRMAFGLASAHIAYPLAERIEKRSIRPKLAALRNHYRIPFPQRLQLARDRLAETLLHAQHHVPYYKELFARYSFDPDKLRADAAYLQQLPCLTKEIIREQGARLLARPIAEIRHHVCKTGGSTGPSCVIYYDQEAADHSAAVTLYARERIGKRKHHPELHFACRFPDTLPAKWPGREQFKSLAMNRGNILFSRLDESGLEQIWRTLKRRRPYLVHAHPSTIHALACHVERCHGRGSAFHIFESSGERLEHHQRRTIGSVLQCKVVNRYGLAEFGVIGYQLGGSEQEMQLLDSEGWPESQPVDGGEQELIFTGFRNKLMPLIRYRTGDLAEVRQQTDGFYMTHVVGRKHDLVPINGIPHPTHHIMDMLDHRVGGIQEFQIDLRGDAPVLSIVLEHSANAETVRSRIQQYWGAGFALRFVSADELVRVGRHQKFRHLVHP